MNEAGFLATLDPDGRGSHWLKVTRKMQVAAAATVGEAVKLEIEPSAKQPEPIVPADLRKALNVTPEAKAVWSDITVAARRDWIQWIVSAKKPETRVRRIEGACDMLAGGKRRVCCFDRSGIYSGALAAPVAADEP